MMLSVKPSDRYSAFGSLLSLTNGKIATELIGPVHGKRSARIKPDNANTATEVNKYHFHFGIFESTGAMLALTVTTSDLAAVGVVDRNSACVTDAVFLTNSTLSVV
jgi:hypothetical protein